MVGNGNGRTTKTDVSKTRIAVLGMGHVGLPTALGLAELGWEVIGFKDGFEGLLPPGHYLVLDRARTSGIMPLGGTIIGTTNRGHFIAKVGAGNRALVAADVIEAARGVLAAHDGNIKAVAQSLFTTFLWPFELTAVLLVIAVIGGVVLARRSHLPADEELLQLEEQDDTTDVEAGS